LQDFPQPLAVAQADLPAIVPLAPHQQGAEPLSGAETHPNAKRLASEIVLALTTYAVGEGPEAIAARLPPEAAGIAATFYVPGASSTGRIIYPQLGGIQTDAASVMVVVEQLMGTDDGVRIEWRTLDVRLARNGGAWHFAGLASAGGDRLDPPAALLPEALAVLNDPRIEMSDSSRWDIYSGLVSPNLLRFMTRIADQWGDFGIVTFSTGHPWEVFGTSRQSDHSRGLAMDLYRLGDDLVIDQHARGSRVYEFAQWVYAQPELRQIGSPWRFGEGGGRSFTDALHQDHVHIAVAP